MRFVRVKHLFLTAAAIFSLFVSAVSACACSHHEPGGKAVESSCHGPSHETPTAEASTVSPHFESDCNCFVQTLVPAVVAKKDGQRTAVGDKVARVLEPQLAPAKAIADADGSGIRFELPRSNYQHALLASLPSRAPPRR